MNKEPPSESAVSFLKSITDIASLTAGVIGYLVALFGLSDVQYAKTASVLTLLLTSVLVVQWRWRKISQKKEETNKKGKKNANKPALPEHFLEPLRLKGNAQYAMPLPRRRAETALLTGIILFTLVWTILNASTAYAEWTGEALLTCNPTRRLDGQLRVVVANLREVNDNETLFTPDNIYNVLTENPMGGIFQVCRLNKEFNLKDEAKIATETYKADVLIWGWMDVNYQFHLEALALADETRSFPLVAMAEAASAEFQLTEPEHIAFATQFTWTEILLLDGQGNAAQTRLSAALREAAKNDLNPHDLAEGYYLLGLFYDPYFLPTLDDADMDAAIEAYTESINAELAATDIDPDLRTYEAWVNRGFLFTDVGREKEAYDDFTYLIEHGNDEYKAIAYLNRASLQQDDPEAAMLDLNAAIKADPLLGSGYYFRGLAFIEQGDYEHAISDLQKAVDLDPELYDNYKYLGLAQLHAGNFDEARTTFIEIVPYLDADSREDVIADLEQLANDDPTTKAAVTGIVQSLREADLP